MFCIFLCSCENNNNTKKTNHLKTSLTNEETSSIKQTVKANEPPLPNKFKHNLPLSNYYYDIEITKVDCKKVKNAFEVTTNKYSAPRFIDGIIISIKYKMTNPYDNEMIVPIPDYYYITSSFFNAGTESTTFHRTCQCYIDNGTTLTYKGEEMYQIYDRRIDNRYCLTFKPKETKEFKVVFDDVRPETIENITFIGFNENNGGTTNAIEKGVNINLKTKKIISQMKFKKK